MEPQAEPRAEEARGRLANRTSEAGASGRSCAVRFRASTTTRLEHTLASTNICSGRGACPVGAATSPLACVV
jgi:hypothetical protein